MQLDEYEKKVLAGDFGPSMAMAMRIVVEAARLLGAEKLISITSSHIDGCLYHGDSGVHFSEKLVSLGAKVSVPTSLNVGSLDLTHTDIVKASTHFKTMARRLMDAHIELGCQQNWSCAPYQTGFRPKLGEQVAWGESNAVVFANSVLGARTNRYGDFLDICAAITGRAPYSGLHITENRRATLVIDIQGLSEAQRADDILYPLLGAWMGAQVGDHVAAILGVPKDISEDALKALGAGAASTGAVGLFHVVGVTPEAATLDIATQGQPVERTLFVNAQMIHQIRRSLSSGMGEELGTVTVGCPHFSFEESQSLLTLAAGRKFKIPFYINTNRAVMAKLEESELLQPLQALGVTTVLDTCVLTTPILEADSGVLMTNSAKAAHYGPGNTGNKTLFGSLKECVESAIAGKFVMEEN